MKKILYIALAEYENAADGVAKKIRGQIRGMEEAGNTVECIAYGQDGIYVFAGDGKQKLAENGRLPMRILLLRAVRERLKQVKYDVCYIRFFYVDFYLKSLLKDMKRRGITVFMEIASYPLETPAGTAGKLLDRMNRILTKDMEKYLSKILYVGNYEQKIWNVRAEAIPNGCNVHDYRLKEAASRRQDAAEINLIAVATMLPHHGFERLLRGMGQYYKKEQQRSVLLHMVGEGIENESYRQICREEQIESYVTFWGSRSGKELDELFDKADIAVASLGMYKGGFYQASLLKVKEYLARGIPFIYACEEIDMEKDLPYTYKVENDSSVIDVEKIAEFYDSVKNVDYRAEMRDYVEKNYSWREILSRHMDEAERR